MATTQKDIARAAGVSQTVVSDVLQGRPRGRVSPETRERILEAARRLRYQPNASAQALRSRHSRQVVYLTTQADADRFGALGERIIGGLARALAERHYRLLLEVAPSHEAAPGLLRELAGAGVCDGCVVRALEGASDLWSPLKQVDCPCVLVGQCSDPELPSVAHDAPGMIRAALRHLAARGHRHIGFVIGPGKGDYHRLVHRVWEQTAPEFEINPRERVLRSADRSEAQAAAGEWLRADPGPTAVICLNERAGVGVSRAVQAADRGLEKDFDLVILSDVANAWLYEPGTWYFATDPAGIGQRAGEELLRMVEGNLPSGTVRILPQLKRL